MLDVLDEEEVDVLFPSVPTAVVEPEMPDAEAPESEAEVDAAVGDPEEPMPPVLLVSEVLVEPVVVEERLPPDVDPEDPWVPPQPTANVAAAATNQDSIRTRALPSPPDGVG